MTIRTRLNGRNIRLSDEKEAAIRKALLKGTSMMEIVIWQGVNRSTVKRVRRSIDARQLPTVKRRKPVAYRLPDSLIERAIALYDEGASVATVMRETGVSDSTARKIRNGWRVPGKSELRLMTEPPFDDTKPAVRCPGCGGMQHMPCKACRDLAALRITRAAKLARRAS